MDPFNNDGPDAKPNPDPFAKARESDTSPADPFAGADGTDKPRHVLSIAGENFDLKAFAEKLKQGVLAPAEFYANTYPQMTNKNIFVGYGLAIAVQVVFSILSTFTISSIVAVPLRMLIAQVILAAAIFGFGKLFCNMKDEFDAIWRWTCWGGTYVALVGAVNIVLGFIFPKFLLALVGFGFGIYILYYGLKSAFRFSNGQAAAFMAVPAGLGAIGLALALVVGMFSASLPLVGFFDQERVEAVLGSDHNTNPEESDIVTAINSLVNDPEKTAEKNEGSADTEIKTVPDIQIGERYVYTYQAEDGSTRSMTVTTSPSELAEEDIKLTFTMDTSDGEQTHEVFLPKGAKITSLESTMQWGMQTGEAHAELQEPVEMFFTASSAAIDGLGAATGVLSLFVPKSALKKEGLDFSTKKVRIAGRDGVKRQIGSSKEGSKITIAKDYTLAFTFLESENTSDNGKTTVLRLKSYRRI
mgnify:CR=1 FL=1